MSKTWIIKRIYKRNFLIVGKKFFNCQLGGKGVISSSKKVEGDKATPIGKFKLNSIYFRKDKVLRSYFKKNNFLKIYQITKNCGWCDDINSSKYNKYVNIKDYLFKNINHENLWREDNAYDIIIVISYNIKPTIKNKGSAIFIHCSFNDYRNTSGCIAVKKTDLIYIIKKLKDNTYLEIKN